MPASLPSLLRSQPPGQSLSSKSAVLPHQGLRGIPFLVQCAHRAVAASTSKTAPKLSFQQGPISASVCKCSSLQKGAKPGQATPGKLSHDSRPRPEQAKCFHFIQFWAHKRGQFPPTPPGQLATHPRKRGEAPAGTHTHSRSSSSQHFPLPSLIKEGGKYQSFPHAQKPPTGKSEHQQTQRRFWPSRRERGGGQEKVVLLGLANKALSLQKVKPHNLCIKLKAVRG